jgi:hypothetical protein
MNSAAPAPVSTAVYLEHSARPKHAPVPSHQPQFGRPALSARTRHTAAPSSAAISGPSGSTQLPAVMPSTGTAFSSTAAHSPEQAP